MNEINLIKPFRRYCITIGNLPTSFMESMTYYECLVWLVNFLENEVIPAVNNNGKVVEELQEKFVALKTYVDNYFDSLDVQQEINNKLDELINTGEMAEIIAQYLSIPSVHGYQTVNDMKVSENLINGSIAITLSKDELGDDKGRLYLIRTKNTTDVIDEDNILSMQNENLVAVLINDNRFDNIKNLTESLINSLKDSSVLHYDTVNDMKNSTLLKKDNIVITKGFYSVNDGGSAKYIITDNGEANESNIISLKNNLFAKLQDNGYSVNVKQFGAKGDNEADDLEKLQICLDYSSQNKLITYIPAGTYLIGGQLLYDTYNVIKGENKKTTIIKTKDGTDLVYHTLVGRNAESINARLARNDTSSAISNGYPKVSEVCGYDVYNISIENLTIDGNWQGRDLNKWNKYYNSILREPGTALEIQRVHNMSVKDLIIINGPQHNLSVDSGDDSYNEGVDYVSKYPSYEILIDNVETNNQRYDDCITTHNSEYITIQNCYVHVDNNVNGTYSSAISNGIEIDDGSRHVKVLNCRSRYNFSAYQAKGHSSSPSAYDVIFENCTAEYCHIAMIISSNRNATNYTDVTGFCKDIIVKNFVSKNMYLWTNATTWNDKSYEVLIDSANNILIDGWTSYFGNPTNNPLITNISSASRINTFENVNTNYYITYRNIKVYNSQNDRSNYPLINIRGLSRNFTFENIFCEGWTSYPMIEYGNKSNDGFCICNNIFLIKRSNDDKIISIDPINLGTRENLFLINEP